MRLFQIPFSHNCVKVRKALDLKGLPYETVDIKPLVRRQVKRASGQTLVPALVDNGRAVSDSTRILLYLEERYPQNPLLPRDPAERAECLVLEEWADSTFMALTRRIAYWSITSQPGALGPLFFPRSPRRVQRVAGALATRALRLRLRMTAEQNRRDHEEAPRAAAVAVARLGGRDHLVGDTTTIADITLASMTSGLILGGPAVRNDPAVQELLDWGRRTLAIDREFVVGELPSIVAAASR